MVGVGNKEQNDAKAGGNPFLGIHFECCNVYLRVYRKPEERSYRGRCPKCLRTLEILVDEEKGISEKFFRAF